jgi:hypothetical protein
MITWLKLKWLEAKLVFGEFGKHKKYLRLCMERDATTNATKLQIAEEVIAGRGVNCLESWAHHVYLKEHKHEAR